MHEIVRTMDDLKDIRRTRRLAPKRDDLRRMFPGKERIETDPKTGHSEWVFDVETHDRNGHQTSAGREMAGAFKPYMAAEAARGRALGAREPSPVALRDGDGGLRYVAPHLADATARKHGWRSGLRPSGSPVYAGEGGMLWRLSHRTWMPLGVRCLGTPLHGSARVSRRGVQRDPDGHPWRWIEGMWRKA